MALEKIRIPKKIASFIKDVVAEVINKQINRHKGDKGDNSHPVAFSTIEFEREMRSRVDELEKHVVNMEAVITQGKCLYESVIKSFPGPFNPTIQIEGDVTINVYIMDCPEGAKFVGQDFILTPQKIGEMIDREVDNRFIIDETNVAIVNTTSAQSANDTKKNELIEKFHTKVKELRKA